MTFDVDDIPALRSQLESGLRSMDGPSLCGWAGALAEHVSSLVGPTDTTVRAVEVCRSAMAGWAAGVLDAEDLRRMALEVRGMALDCSGAEQSAVRSVAASIISCHSPGEAIVASDYSVRMVNILMPDDMDAVMLERMWQILAAEGL